MRTIVLAALAVGQTGGSAPEPLKPVAPWKIEYASSMCIANRSYGDAGAPVTVGFRPTPFGDVLQVVVIGTRGQLGRQARVDVTLTAPGRDLGRKLTATRVHFPDGDRAVLTFYISRPELEALVDAPAFTVGASDGSQIKVALSMGKSVLAALQTCEIDLLKHFGYDPAKIAAIARRAEAVGRDDWITYKDYPQSALAAGERGQVLIGWTIRVNGRVSDCRVLQTSGVPELDEAACSARLRRGRYRAALDAANNPVESYATRYVNWVTPG